MNPWQPPAQNDHFSEFTYGFALVNELVSNKPRIVNVPVFPSLIMEGQTGGGYDVYLDRPGRPMFLQFKLARYIKGHRAKEFQERTFRKPFYRMSIRSKGASQQHELLLELEKQTKAAVYYCAPAFHTLGQLNTLYNARQVARQSRFVRPSALPPIQDDDKHWLSYQRARGGTTAFYSEHGKRLELDDRPIQERLAEDLAHADEVPLRETLATLARWLEEQVPREQADLKSCLPQIRKRTKTFGWPWIRGANSHPSRKWRCSQAPCSTARSACSRRERRSDKNRWYCPLDKWAARLRATPAKTKDDALDIHARQAFILGAASPSECSWNGGCYRIEEHTAC